MMRIHVVSVIFIIMRSVLKLTALVWVIGGIKMLWNAEGREETFGIHGGGTIALSEKGDFHKYEGPHGEVCGQRINRDLEIDTSVLEQLNFFARGQSSLETVKNIKKIFRK
jgi:hypothetical protein